MKTNIEYRKWYEEERLLSTLNYLPPTDYYTGDPEVLLTEQERKLKAAAPDKGR